MSKGGTFERDICKQLSLWWTNNLRDDIFWRTSGSGSRSTSRKKKGFTTQNSAGDVGYLDADGKPLIDILCIEIKRGYTSAGRITKKLKEELADILQKHNEWDRGGSSDITTDVAIKRISKVFSKTKKRGKLDALDIIDSPGNKRTALEDFWKQCEDDRNHSNRIFSWVIFKRDMKQISVMVSEHFMETAEQLCGEYCHDILTIRLESNLYNLYIVNFSKLLEWCTPETVQLICEDCYYKHTERIID